MAPIINPQESIQAYRHRLDGVAISTYVLIMLLVPLKIFCRQRHGGWHNVRMDDYMSMFALACANGFFYLLCVIFNCIPVHAAWDITVTGAKCIPIRSIYLGGSVPNVVLDLFIVMLPIPHVWRLHAPLAQRIVLAGMFALGTFIAVVSLVRLIIFLQIPIATQGDVTYNFREIIVWSIVEINIGLTCACLPSLKPAFQMIGLNRLFSFSSSRPSEMRTPGASGVSGGLDDFSNPKMGSGRPRKKGATGGLFSTLAGMSRMEDEEECKFVDDNMGKNNVEIEMGRVSGDSGQRTQSGGISVQKNWSVLVDERKTGHS
ncbi:conserved hypothetical protein [Pyrenophora tritici-repentis Pt-1C-BFP]|uniref:Rhodopsin domain-containing protein n=1 Tax=Pyrenophora tritici-repentis (strain Pt-1C-BFP) TaxID=426418 RepID=B2WDZ0_PYRTR|nr:uncharacterized protein PTRG_08363 [Pyrenophora tritici-repentis Pt-1C-BFP]EDU51282.1 conserved hypothetical protein [Pyrenophora tritici-repentis Pt-1C-BFP]